MIHTDTFAVNYKVQKQFTTNLYITCYRFDWKWVTDEETAYLNGLHGVIFIQGELSIVWFDISQETPNLIPVGTCSLRK